MSKQSIFTGTGVVTWLYYLVVAGVLFYFFVPKDSPGLVGILTIVVVTFRIELNRQNQRIRSLEERIRSL
ncbi:hypothetical protein HQ496_03205 [bacterium]|nr:hypothetical protein [bacterium]